MSKFSIRALTHDTWSDFDLLLDAHNGVFGGCWCMGFHAGSGKGRSYEERRADKRQLVDAGMAHAAMVYVGDRCVGWCQFGSPAELPEIKNKKNYFDTQTGEPPLWRVTCFFVDRHHRKQGVAAAALEGALTEIAKLGGGAVEGYPEDTRGTMVSPTFLHAGTLAMFQAFGFTVDRQIGKNKYVVRKTVTSP